MTISGNMTDSSSGKPIPGVIFNVYSDGDFTKPPIGTFQSDGSGNYTYTNAALDMVSYASVSATLAGYAQVVGSPGFFNGANTMDPLLTTIAANVPTWVWAVVGLAGLIVIFYLYKNYKK